jgi:O-acetylserine/cysteine efflux transporter
VPAELAGAFVNLEPVVGALTGAVAFQDPLGLEQALGGLAILAGIAVSALSAGPSPSQGPTRSRVFGASTVGHAPRRARVSAARK